MKTSSNMKITSKMKTTSNMITTSNLNTTSNMKMTFFYLKQYYPRCISYEITQGIPISILLRCICKNAEERVSCLSEGKVWNPASCHCHCPLVTIQPCSTGYRYDYLATCSCLQVAAEASEGIIAATVILILAILATTASG